MATNEIIFEFVPDTLRFGAIGLGIGLLITATLFSRPWRLWT